MYTKHGHQIVGSPVEGDPPKERARCSGMLGCPTCQTEVGAWHRQHPQEAAKWREDQLAKKKLEIDRLIEEGDN